MIVVADTSPINYLILIEEIGALEKLYERVAIPFAVHQELLRAKTPARPLLKSLGDGEREAICLAEELHASQLIIDERHGRRAAAERGFLVTGTIGVLQEAARLGILDLSTALQRLQQTNFHISPVALARLIKNTP